MKHLFSLILVFFTKISFSAPCEVVIVKGIHLGNASPVYNFGADFNANSCGPHDYNTHIAPQNQFIINFWVSGGGEPTLVYNLGNEWLQMKSQMRETGIFNPSLIAQAIMDNMTNVWHPDIIHIDIKCIASTMGSGTIFGEQPANTQITYSFYLYFPKNAKFLKTLLCTEQVYSKNELFEFPMNEPNLSYYNESIQFSTGNTFDWFYNINFSPSADQFLTINYQAMVNSGMVPGNNDAIPVKKQWVVPLRTVFPADFIGMASNVLTNSNQFYLNPYVVNYPDGYVYNDFFGPGIFLQSGTNNNWILNPAMAGPGIHTISYRTSNQGCFSDWVDTTINITGVTSVVNAPFVDYNFTFGPSSGGNLGFWQPPYLDNEGSPEPGYFVYDKNFHFVCSNTEYNFKILNPNQYLSYEWEVYYHNQLYDSGTGITFNLETPDRNSVLENQIFGTQTAPFDYENNFFLISNSGSGSSYLGDVLRIYVRAKNVLNETSTWRVNYLGVTPTPELTSSIICSNSNDVEVDLELLSSTSFYLDSFSFSDVRSMRLDYNNDGLWDFQGSTTSLNNSTWPKIKDMRIQIVDSVKMYGYSESQSSWFSSYHPYVSTVCYSSIDTISLVKAPVFSVNFNQLGSVPYGTAIQGIVTGTNFSPSSDDVLWQWSDGSELYNNDTLWHFMNDLGSYSLTVTVVDSFGCSSTLNFDSLWFVPGGLSVDELISDDILIYPNPAADFVYVKNIDFTTDFELFDLLGKSHVITKSLDGKLLLPAVSNGLYFLRFSSSNKNYNIPLQIIHQ